MKTETAMAEMAGAQNTMTALLVLALDARGLLSKGEFAALLKRQIEALKDDPPKHWDGGVRFDLKVIQGVVDHLEGPPPKGWTPVVIKGGKE